MNNEMTYELKCEIVRSLCEIINSEIENGYEFESSELMEIALEICDELDRIYDLWCNDDLKNFELCFMRHENKLLGIQRHYSFTRCDEEDDEYHDDNEMRVILARYHISVEYDDDGIAVFLLETSDADSD